VYIILQKKENSNFYSVKNTDNESMKTLVDFLNDISNGINTWKNFIITENEKYRGTNSTLVSKEKDKILIEYLWVQENYQGEYDVTLTQQQFLYLLDRWKELINQKVQEITIKLDNDIVSIAGKV
jgi:hypothetical protein